MYISELGGQEQAEPTLRVLLSEGELCLATTEMDGGRITPHVIKTTGRPVYVTTTTQSVVERQLGSRTWLLEPDETKEQTERILQYQGENATKIEFEGYTEDEMVLKSLLYELKPNKVLLPFARQLSRLFPKTEIQARRDFKRLVSLIKTITILHQRQRFKVNILSQECLVASLTDLAYGMKIVEPILLMTLYGLPNRALEIIKIMKTLPEIEDWTTATMGKHLKLSQNRTRRILKGLIDRGFISKDDSKRPHKYRYTEKDVEEINTILSMVSEKDFFTLTEFNFWLYSLNTKLAEKSSDVYDQYIVNSEDNEHMSSLLPPTVVVSNETTEKIASIRETGLKIDTTGKMVTIKEDLLPESPKPKTIQEVIDAVRKRVVETTQEQFLIEFKKEGLTKSEAEQLFENLSKDGDILWGDKDGECIWTWRK